MPATVSTSPPSRDGSWLPLDVECLTSGCSPWSAPPALGQLLLRSQSESEGQEAGFRGSALQDTPVERERASPGWESADPGHALGEGFPPRVLVYVL